MATNSAESVALENAIDRLTLSNTLEEMAEICYAKAEHLRSNWGDPVQAKEWDKAGGKLASLAGKVTGL